MKLLIFIIPILTWAYAAHAEPQKGYIEVPLILTNDNYTKDCKLRCLVNVLHGMVEAKKFIEAEKLATQLRSSYEAQFNKHLKQHTFQSEDEYNEFKTVSPDQFERIDWGYKECLQLQTFIKSEKRDFLAALEILREIEQLAPISAGTFIEHGYVLNQLGNHDEALIVYRKALDLSVRYTTQRPFQAASLRGIGYSLIDLNRLDEAEDAYRESLKLEPSSSTALTELKNIREMKVIRALRDAKKTN